MNDHLRNIRLTWENFLARITIENELGDLKLYGHGEVRFTGQLMFKMNKEYSIILEKAIPVEETLITIYMDGVWVDKSYLRWIR